MFIPDCPVVHDDSTIAGGVRPRKFCNCPVKSRKILFLGVFPKNFSTHYNVMELRLKPMGCYGRCLFVTAYLVLAAGCTNEPAPQAPPDPVNSAPTDSTINNSLQSDVRPPADKSLTLEIYIEAGLPAHDRNWSGDDMTRAAKILAAIAQTDTGHLPRYRSQHSGAAFERLTANDNLDMYRSRSLPLEQRLPDALNYMQSSNQILKLYLAAFNQHAVGDSELVELAGAQLRVSVVMIRLVNEFLPTLEKDDPTYPVRMDGLRRMKGGMASVVAGNLQTLTESHAYRTSELKRLVGYMQSTLPDILPELSEGSRTESLIRLRSFSDDPQMQHLNPELDQLLAAAEKSSQPDKVP